MLVGLAAVAWRLWRLSVHNRKAMSEQETSDCSIKTGEFQHPSLLLKLASHFFHLSLQVEYVAGETLHAPWPLGPHWWGWDFLFSRLQARATKQSVSCWRESF